MTKWEYKFLTAADLEKRGFLLKSVEPEQIEAYLNALGDEGWEVVNLDFTDTTAFVDFRGVAKRAKH